MGFRTSSPTGRPSFGDSAAGARRQRPTSRPEKRYEPKTFNIYLLSVARAGMHDATAEAAVGALLVLAASVAAVGGAPVAGALGTVPADSVAETSGEAIAGDEPLAVTMTYGLTPARSGEVVVRLAVENPGAVRGLGVRIRDRMTVVSADGFGANHGAYVWDGETTRPTLTYRTEANVSRGTGDDRRYGSVDAGEWALLAGYGYTIPPVGYRGMGENRPDVTYRVDGEGVASSGVVFLGPGETHARTVEGQRVRLYVPDAAAADLSASPERTLGTLTDAAAALDVGERRDRATTVAAPMTVDWTFEGRAPGFTGTVVRADRPLNRPGDTWVHEYVHLRQPRLFDEELRWFREGSADYYAGLSAYQSGRASFDEFHRYVSAERRPALLDATLADPETWLSESVEYAKGRRVLAALDAKIREETNGTRTLEDVLWRLNRHDGEVTYTDFEDAVAAAAGRRYDDWLAANVAGSAVPAVPEAPARYERVADADHDPPTPTRTPATTAHPSEATTAELPASATTSQPRTAATSMRPAGTATAADQRRDRPVRTGTSTATGPGVGVPGALLAFLLVALRAGRW